MSQNMGTSEGGEVLRKFTRELPVALNDHELQTYGKMLAEKCKEQELALDKKKQVTADHNNRIKVITNEIKRIADARAKGEELRPVMCGERLHGNVVEIIRLDSGVVVDSRPAGLQDLQTSIPEMDGSPIDEGPRGTGLGSVADRPVEPNNVIAGDFGGPDKTGRGIDPTVSDTPGEMSTSSSGDVVYNGAPDDRADSEDMPPGYGDEAQAVEDAAENDGDALPTDEEESDTPSGELKLAECATCGGAVTEGMSYEVIGTGRLVHAPDCLPNASGEASAAKPTRDRSRKSNESKGSSKTGKAKRKK